MSRKAKRTQELDASLVEGIAAAMAADAGSSEPAPEPVEMADLFLEELNRLWAEPLPDEAA